MLSCKGGSMRFSMKGFMVGLGAMVAVLILEVWGGWPSKSLAEKPGTPGDTKGDGAYFGQIVYGTYLTGLRPSPTSMS